MNAAILKQAGYGLKFTTISEAEFTSLMGESRKIAPHAAHVVSAEPRDLTGVLWDLYGLGITNWYTETTAYKGTMLQYMLNDDEEGDLHRMAITEMWE